MKMNIPKTIVNLREQKNMSQVELSKLMNLNKNVMGRIERGERPLRDNEILKLAQIFNVSTDLILGKQETADRLEEKDYWSYVEKTEKDVAKQVESLIDRVEEEENLYFYGEPITADERNLLAGIFEVGLRVSKEKGKKSKKIR